VRDQQLKPVCVVLDFFSELRYAFVFIFELGVSPVHYVVDAFQVLVEATHRRRLRSQRTLAYFGFVCGQVFKFLVARLLILFQSGQIFWRNDLGAIE